MVEIITENNELAIQNTAAALNSGKCVVFPTETVYALACDASNDMAVQNIYRIKGRDEAKPLSILVSSLEMIENIIEITPQITDLVTKYMPGPLTIVAKIKNQSNLSKYLNNGAETVGFRIPDHKFCLELLHNFNKPIIGTSANLSGMEAGTNAKQILAQLSDKIELIVDGGESKIGIPSTVIDMSSATPKILRKGIISFDI